LINFFITCKSIWHNLLRSVVVSNE